MISEQWRNIIAILRVVGKDAINDECIKTWLQYDREANIDVLNELFSIGIVSKEEYIEYARRIVKRKYDDISSINHLIS